MTATTHPHSPRACVTCQVCGAVLPPQGKGQYCVGCASRVRGIDIALGHEKVLVGEEGASPIRIRVTNAGQTPLQIANVSLIDRYSKTRTSLWQPSGAILDPSATDTLAIEIPAATVPGTYDIEVVTEEGVRNSVPCRVIPLPRVSILSDETCDAGPVMVLQPREARGINRPDTSGERVSAEDWFGEVKLCVQSLVSDPVAITDVDLVYDGRAGPVKLDAVNSVAEPRAEIPIPINANKELVSKAASEGVRAEVKIRIKDYGGEIRRAFMIQRQLRCRLAVEWGPLRLRSQEEKVPGTDASLMHGLGQRMEVTVEVRNKGDLDVVVTGAILTGSEAVRLANPNCLHNRILPKGSSQSGTITGEPVSLIIEPDRLPFEAYPSGDKHREVKIQLQIPVRDQDHPQDHSRIESTDSYTIFLGKAEIKEDAFLCIDLGTTNTCVFWVPPSTDEGTHAERLPLPLDPDPDDSLGNEYPSIVQFDNHPEGLYRFGQIERDKAWVDLRCLQATAMEFKPQIKSDKCRCLIDMSSHPVQVRAREIATIYLKHVVRAIQRLHLWCHPVWVGLTCPVDFDQQEKDTLISIMRAALAHVDGSDDIQITADWSEPEALLINMLCTPTGFTDELPLNQPKIIAMFDFGGGTTDLLVQRVTLTDGNSAEERGLKRRYLYKHTFREAGEALTRVLSHELWPAFKAVLLKEMQESKDESWKAIIDSYVPPRNVDEADGLDGDGKQIYSAMIQVAERIKRKLPVLKGACGAGEKKETLIQSFKIGSKSARNIDISVAISPDWMKKVEKVIDDFVRPKLEAFEEVESRLKEQSNRSFDIVYLAGNSSRLTRVQELAQEIFGKERVRFVGDEFAKAGVARGLAWACLKNIPAMEDRFVLRIGERLLDEHKSHEVELATGSKVEVLWQEDFELGKENVLFSDEVPAAAVPQNGIVKVSLDTQESGKIKLQFFDPTSGHRLHEISHEYQDVRRSRMCFVIGQRVYMEGERHDVILQLPRLGIKRVDALGHLDGALTSFDLREALQGRKNVSLLLTRDADDAVLSIFEKGVAQPFASLRQSVAS